jgi:DNA invertase Pin-like site-specific DNA recombinase
MFSWPHVFMGMVPSGARKMSKIKRSRIGCYVRVSTVGKDQTTASQRQIIKDWAKANHVRTDDLKWYEDRLSGATTDRPQLQKLLKAIEQGKIDTLCVFRLDRLSRSTRDGLQILADVAKKGIRVVSVSENIDFGSSVGMLIASILLSVGSFERETTISRIRAGILAAKASGKHCGRPRDDKKLMQIRRWFDSGMKATMIATRMKCTRANVYCSLSKTQENKRATA